MHLGLRSARTTGAALLLGFLALGGAQGGLAQDSTPVAGSEGRPAHIHSGSCGDDLGGVVQALTNLTPAEGDGAGQEAATVAESSFTNVPVTLDDVLAEDHAINVHLSADEIETYIACGEIGGPTDETGSLVIGLAEQSGSGFTGIAVLTPNADGITTDVSVFVAEELAGEGGGDAASPVAAGGGEAVTVTMTEWTLDMPTTLAAGEITFDLVNDGEFPHTIDILDGEEVVIVGENVEPGESGTLSVELAPGTYTVICPVGDGRHRERGMELELTVE